MFGGAFIYAADQAVLQPWLILQILDIIHQECRIACPKSIRLGNKIQFREIVDVQSETDSLVLQEKTLSKSL